jgi:hypothetical protein
MAVPDSASNNVVQGTESINSGLAGLEYPTSNQRWFVKV